MVNLMTSEFQWLSTCRRRNELGWQGKQELEGDADRCEDRPQAWGQDHTKKISNEPKEVGSGAERLAAPNLQEIHHRPMVGPSFQQGCGRKTAEGQLTLVEGSVEVEVVHISGTEQQ
jgi:hypothetical protein